MATSGMLPHSQGPCRDHQQLVIGWLEVAGFGGFFTVNVVSNASGVCHYCIIVSFGQLCCILHFDIVAFITFKTAVTG